VKQEELAANNSSIQTQEDDAPKPVISFSVVFIGDGSLILPSSKEFRGRWENITVAESRG
jgi:hypothetical protein